MGKAIRVKDGQYVYEAYKEYLINGLISMATWRGGYARKWIAAAHAQWSQVGSIVLNGREYFGGNVIIGHPEIPAIGELLDTSGFDKSIQSEIRSIDHKSKVRYVALRFKPKQTYTIEGLTYMLRQEVKRVLQDESSTSFTLTHTTGGTINKQTPMPTHSFKSQAHKFVTDGGSLISSMSATPTTDKNVNEVLEVMYRISSIIDNNCNISTTVTENEFVDEETYSYTTNTTITFDNGFDFIDSNDNIQALFDIVHFENLGDYPYYYSERDDKTVKVYTTYEYSLAGYMWHLENGYTGKAKNFEDDDGLVIYYNESYWIDRKKFESSPADLCVLTLGKLLDIYVSVRHSGNFFNSGIGGIFGGFLKGLGSLLSIATEILGELVYAVFFVMGVFLVDVVFTSDSGVKKFKKISKAVFGTVALAVLTIGLSKFIQAGSAGAGTMGMTQAQYLGVGQMDLAIANTYKVLASMTPFEKFMMVLNTGLAGYTATMPTTPEQYQQTQVIEEETKDPIAILYDDEEYEDTFDIAEIFHDGVYLAMDAEMDVDV